VDTRSFVLEKDRDQKKWFVGGKKKLEEKESLTPEEERKGL